MKKYLVLLLSIFALISCNNEDDYPTSLKGLWTAATLNPAYTYVLHVSEDDYGKQQAFIIMYSSDFEDVVSTEGEFLYNPETGIGLIKSSEAAESSVTFTFQAYRGEDSKLALTIAKPGDEITVDMHLLGTAIDFPTGAWDGQILINEVMYDARLVISDNPTESQYGTFTLKTDNPAQYQQMPIVRLSLLARPFFSETGAYGIYVVKDGNLYRITTVRYDVVSKRMWIIFKGGTSDMEYENPQ